MKPIENSGEIGEKKAGQYLKTNFYSRGAEQSLDGLMRSGTGEPLTPRYLIQFLQGTTTKTSVLK